MSEQHRKLNLKGDRVVGFDPAHPGAERTVDYRQPYPAIPQIREIIDTTSIQRGTAIHKEIERGIAELTRAETPDTPLDTTLDTMRKIHELIQKGLSDARRTPEYFEEAFSQGHINVALVFEMLAAFKEMRNDSARCTQLTINELRTICELRVGPIPQDEIRQVIANIAKRLK